jgi:hypothetical protein
MPDINMQVFEEAKRNQLVTEVDIQTQAALDDYQVQLSDIANPTQSQDNVVIDRFGEFLPHWNESLDFDTWVKMSMEVAGKRILVLRGNSSVSSKSDGNDTFINFDDFITDDYTDTGSLIGVDIADARMEFQGVRSSTDHRSKIAVSLAENFEFITKIQAISSAGEGGLLWVYLSDTDAAYKSSTDAIGIVVAEDSTSGGYYVFADHYDGSVRTHDAANLYNINTATDYIISLSRVGNDITIKLMNTSLSVLYTKTWTGTSLGILTYQQFANLPDGIGVENYITGFATPMYIKNATAVEPTWLADGVEQNIAIALKSLGRAG